MNDRRVEQQLSEFIVKVQRATIRTFTARKRADCANSSFAIRRNLMLTFFAKNYSPIIFSKRATVVILQSCATLVWNICKHYSNLLFMC